MKECIEKEAAVSFAQHAYNQWNLATAAADGQREINLVYKRQELCKAVKSVFSDMLAADVAEVVHGEWKTDRFGMERSICSICNSVYEGGDRWRYCPMCGAKNK